MLGIVIFTAMLSALICINGTPLSNRELQAIMKVMEGHAEKENSPEESTSDSDGGHELVPHLKTMDVMKLIQQASIAKDKRKNEFNTQNYRARPDSLEQHHQKHHHVASKSHNHGWNVESLQKLLKEELKKPSQQASHHHHVAPNRLLNAIKNAKLKTDDDQGGLNDYSKIFLILDPVALQESKNNDEMPNLISRILSQSSSAIQKAHLDGNNPSRYKGFMLKDNPARRFRRESKESYGGGGGGGGDDDDYRPKRPRNDNRGGGGGGGRTAIPYIRHRGDIYEREQH